MAITLVSAPANFYPYLDNAVYNNGKGKLCVGNSVVTDYNSSDINANKNVLFPVGFWGWGGNVLSGDKDVVFGKFTGKYRLLSQSVTDTKNLQNLYGGNGDYRMYEVLLYNPVTNVTNEGVTASYQVEFMDYRNDFSGNITNVSNYNSYLRAVEDDGNVTAVVWRDFQSNYFPHTGAEYNAFNLAQTGKRFVDWDVYFKDYNQKFITVFKKVLGISRDVVWRGYDYVPVGYKKITLWPEEYGFGGPARIYGNSVKNIGVELEDFNFVETGICFSKTHSTLNIAVDSKAVRTEELIVGGAYHMNVMGLDLNSNYYMAGYALYANGDVVYSPTKQVQTKATKVLPSFIFAVAGTITNNSAKISCRVAENDYTVSEAGVCYATHVNPTTADDKETLETLPSGVLSLTGLAAGTKHYVRQYAVYNGETVYSELSPAVDLAFVGDHFYGVGSGEGLFPYASLTDYFTTAGAPVLGKVIGSIPTEIQLGETTVQLDAHITSEGGGTVTEAGMWLSTSPNPAVTGKKTVFTGSFVNGSLGKQFTTTYTGLIPGTLYYYAPYCKNVAGTFTSNDTTLRFRTYENTGVAITKATKLSSTSLNVEYNFTGIGKGEVDAIGLCYKQNGVPTIADAKTVDGTELGAYKTVIGMLQNNVSYNIRPYITKTVNGGSTVTEYGDMITASMTDVAVVNPKPTIATLDTEGWKLETRNVQLSANVTLMGVSNIIRKGFVLAKVTNLLDPTPITGIANPNSGNLGVNQSVVEVDLNGKGNELGLMWKYINPAAGAYHFAAFAVNNDGTSYGAIKFLTVPSLSDLGLDTPASAITSPAAANKNSAILWGIAVYNWDSDIAERGFLYWKKSTPGTVLEKLVTEETTAFSGEVTGLLASTAYEFKAFVKETGESRVFGDVLEFTTLAAEAIEPTVILQSAIKNDTGFECFVESLTNEELLLGKGVVWIRNEDGIFDTIPTINSNRIPVGPNGEDLQMNVGVGWYMIAAYIETAQGMKVSLNGLKVVQWTHDTPDTDTDGNPITDTTQKFMPPKNPAPYVGQDWNFRNIARYVFNGEGWVKQRNATVNNSPLSPVQDNGGSGSASRAPMQQAVGGIMEYIERDIAGNKIDETYFKSKMFLMTVDLMSITTEPALEFGGPDYYGMKYYNDFEKKIYTARDVMPGMFVWVEAKDPELGVLYNFEGLSYLWNGTGLERVNINPAYDEMLENFEDANY